MTKYLCIIILLTTLCTQTETFSESSKEQVASEVIEMFNKYHSDIKADGLTAEFNYLDSSADFFWVPPGYASALSYDSVRTILRSNAVLFQSVEFSWEALQVFPLSDQIATYAGIVKGVLTDTAGVMTEIRIIESGTVIKRINGWKLLSGQSAALEPASD